MERFLFNFLNAFCFDNFGKIVWDKQNVENFHLNNLINLYITYMSKVSHLLPARHFFKLILFWNVFRKFKSRKFQNNKKICKNFLCTDTKLQINFYLWVYFWVKFLFGWTSSAFTNFRFYRTIWSKIAKMLSILKNRKTKKESLRICKCRTYHYI